MNNRLLVRGTMNITYDKDADCLYIQFQQGKVHKTKKIEEGIMVDLDEEGYTALRSLAYRKGCRLLLLVKLTLICQ